METEKRKREDDGEDATVKKGKQGKDVEDGASVANPPPEDEEVEEFFAILRRIHVAVKYFQGRRNGVRSSDSEDLKEKSSVWTPLFQPEDFELGDVKKGPEKSAPAPEDGQDAGLDLDTDPTSDVSSSG